MKINAFELRLETNEGVFGSRCTFRLGLNVIRGNNSSGKSTFLNSLIYGLGLEELLGGKNTLSLTSAVTEKFKHDGRELNVVRSETLVEVENHEGVIVTLNRAIKDDARDPRLVQIIHGPAISLPKAEYKVEDKFLHDKGSAFLEQGYYRYFSEFLGFKLPRVANNSGNVIPLYLQTIFSAAIVEQKRGWSDYLANCPYFEIKNNKTRVVEFILGLDVFENDLKVSKLNGHSISINDQWRRIYIRLESYCRQIGAFFEGLPQSPTPDFDASKVRVWKAHESAKLDLAEYIAKTRRSLLDLSLPERASSPANEGALATQLARLQRLSVQYESVSSAIAIQRNSIEDVARIHAETANELQRNKSIRKLHRYGSNHGLETAQDKCPTCLQSLNGSLMAAEVFGPQMNLDQSISYQEKQVQMLQRQNGAIEAELRRLEISESELSKQIQSAREIVEHLRLDLRSTAAASRAALWEQMQTEDALRKATNLEEYFKELLPSLKSLSEQLKANVMERRQLPKDHYSERDRTKIGIFEKNFRANASAFDYQSVEAEKIKIGLGNLLPHLEDIELRSFVNRLRADSSASDFIRLIWSYDLALYQTAAMQEVSGHHPGILIFDEPAQHSMGEGALRSLFLQLSANKKLQSIVAASFEESDHAFMHATTNINFHLVRIDSENRSIGPGPKNIDVAVAA